jgi:hypothetical protein
MDSMITLSMEKYKFFMFENENALIVLKIRDVEITKWGKLLDDLINKIESLAISELVKETDLLFKKDLIKKKDELHELSDLFELQQKRLDNNLKLNIEDDYEGYMIQDILRDKMKTAQISLIELKYRFMVHFSTSH